MKLRQALNDFVSALELTEAQRTAASRQHTVLRDRLARILNLDPRYNTFLTGSYARRTAIRPLNDIDMFCVLAPEHHSESPRLVQRLVKRALDEAYPGKAAEPRNRAVKISFEGTEIAYDVVPAFVDGPDVFRIPDRAEDRWIRSNPKRHQEIATRANDRAGGDLKPLTKVVKHWNNRQSRRQQLASFHLEVMAWDVLTAKPHDRSQGLVDLFRGLARRVRSPVPDPAGLGPAVDAGLVDRSAAAGRLMEAGAIVARAIEFDRDGHPGHAHASMRGLLGRPYPVRGA